MADEAGVGKGTIYRRFVDWVNTHLEIALGAEMAAQATTNAVSSSFTSHIRALTREMKPASNDLALATLFLGTVDPSGIGRLRKAGIDLTNQQAAARTIVRGLSGPRRE